MLFSHTHKHLRFDCDRCTTSPPPPPSVTTTTITTSIGVQKFHCCASCSAPKTKILFIIYEYNVFPLPHTINALRVFLFHIHLDSMCCALLLMFPTRTTTIGISVDSTPNAVQLAHSMILGTNEKEKRKYKQIQCPITMQNVCIHIEVDRVCCIPWKTKYILYAYLKTRTTK